MTDVDQLKEDFTELSNVVPLVPDQVNTLRESAQRLADEAASLHGETEAARQDVAATLAHVRNTLPGFTVQVEALDKRLEGALAGVDAAWTEGSGHVDDGEAALKTAAEGADSARTDLMRALFEAGTTVDQATAEGDALIGKLEAAANDGADRIKTAVDGLAQQLNTLETHLEHTAKGLSESCDVFLERVQQFVDSVLFDTGYLIDHLIARAGQYTAHLTEVAGPVESGTETAVTGIGTRVTEAVKDPLTLAAENLRIEVERLAAAATSQQEAVVKELAAHNEALAELKEAVVPMERGIGEIREAVVRLRQQ